MAVDHVLDCEMLIAFEVPLSAAVKERILSSKVIFRKINSVLKGAKGLNNEIIEQGRISFRHLDKNMNFVIAESQVFTY